MKKIYIAVLILMGIIFSSPLVAPTLTYASSGNCGSSNTIDYGCLPHVAANHNTIAIILNIAFGIIGTIAVIVIILAGMKFITSSGKPEAIAQAKDTIIYAAIGLGVSILAVTIVSFIAGLI